MATIISPVENVDPNGIQVHANTVSVNDVIQQVIKEYNTQKKATNAIIRCEALPRVKARKEQLAELFQGLLSTIFDEVPKGSKLFLYIDCRDDSELSLPERSLYHLILVNTNITSCKNWHSRHHKTLEHCNQLVKKIGGSLQTNINSSSCVFVISLPR